jgi:hypothetical protein
MQRAILTPELVSRFSPPLGVALAQARRRTGNTLDLAFDKAEDDTGRFVALVASEIMVAGEWSADPAVAWRTFIAAVSARMLELQQNVVWN